MRKKRNMHECNSLGRAQREKNNKGNMKGTKDRKTEREITNRRRKTARFCYIFAAKSAAGGGDVMSVLLCAVG